MRHDRDLMLMTAAVAAYALAFGLYYQFIGVYALSLGASRLMVGALTSVMYIVWAAGMLPGAWLATRYSLRWVIVLDWWVTVPAAACFALAPSWQWLLPGLVLSGLYMANNPAMKVYIQCKTEPSRLAGTMSVIFGANSAGFILAPLAGGFLADRLGMRAVFGIAAAIFAVSSTLVTFIRDVPYTSSRGAPSRRELTRNRLLGKYLAFFLTGFLAVYVAQPFLSPYLSQVHGQKYAALGVFAALVSTGATAESVVMGRLADRDGPRLGVGLTLGLLLAGLGLLLLGSRPVVWGLAMLLCGGFDAFRYVAYGVSSRSFGELEPAWGYGIFDTCVGLAMAGGALLGGVMYRLSYQLPFIVTMVLAAGLIAALVASRKRRQPAERRRREAWDSSTT